jgi:hypothetical protein
MKESGVIEQMLELNYIPCIKSTFYCQYKDYREGKPTINTEWSAGGRPRLVDESFLASMVNDMIHECGKKYGHEDIYKKMVEHHNKKISEAGHILLNPDRELKPSTLPNYVTITKLAMNNNLSLTSKTNT